MAQKLKEKPEQEQIDPTFIEPKWPALIYC